MLRKRVEGVEKKLRVLRNFLNTLNNLDILHNSLNAYPLFAS